MQRSSEQVNVYTQDGYIIISQKQEDMPVFNIQLTPDQIAILIEWLQEAKEKLEK